MAGVPAPKTLACGNCSQPMQVLALQGHYGRAVEIDLCAPCHLVWFDPVESARLAGPGLLALIGTMAEAHTLAHNAARPGLHCPHCRGGLKTVHNRTRWGQSLQLECSQGHGSWQTFAQFLTEKGLLRPLSSADRARAHAAGAVHCINCGGALGPADERCSWCTSVPALVDVARLARALDPESATAGHAVHGTATRGTALQCAACGAAQPPEPGWQCTSCGATLAAIGLAEAHQKVQALGPALRAHAAKPAPHVVQQRLAAQQRGLDRERERVEQWQKEAEQAERRHPGWPVPVGDEGLFDWLQRLQQHGSRWALLAAVVVVLALWFL